MFTSCVKSMCAGFSQFPPVLTNSFLDFHEPDESVINRTSFVVFGPTAGQPDPR